MKKVTNKYLSLKIIAVVLFCGTTNVKAQSYPIPGALQQPKWVFPLFIEDGIGHKDTVYIGYDSAYANFLGCYDDGLFNEINYWSGSIINFKGYSCTSTFGPNNDSIRKVDIRSSLSNYFILLVDCVMNPVTIKWDVSLLRSDSLPFPSNGNLPRAQLNIGWYYDPNDLQDPNCGSWGIVVTDTCNYSCCRIDSVTIYDIHQTGQPYGIFLDLWLRPWTGYITQIIEVEENNLIKVLPNPIAKGKFRVEGHEKIISYSITDAYGRLLKNEMYNDTEIETGNVNSGIYFFIAQTQTQTIKAKFISP